MIKKCLSSKYAPEAIGPYSSALKICDYVYLSGQLPVDPSTNQIVDGGVYEQTVQCLKNLNAILDEVDLDVNYLVNVRVYLTDMQDYDKMNEAYSSMFKEPYPSRVVVGVKELPKGAKVEIEGKAIDFRALEILCGDDNCECSCEGGSCCGGDE
ncbi:MAG: Rid family detoxifying hydrolase [Bulleidia sp.]|nr:Rid family detoxifying hydrolase [Bulleidia sp.]